MEAQREDNAEAATPGEPVVKAEENEKQEEEENDEVEEDGPDEDEYGDDDYLQVCVDSLLQLDGPA